MILITIEGGLVQGVSSDDPAEQGRKVLIVDYDADGADPNEIEHVPQGKGDTEDAVLSTHEVGRLYGPVARFLKKKGHGSSCKVLRKPLTVQQVRRLMDGEGFITVVVRLSMDELGVSRDCLNDAMSTHILADECGLEDAGYYIVGATDGDALVKVTGNVRNWLDGR